MENIWWWRNYIFRLLQILIKSFRNQIESIVQLGVLEILHLSASNWRTSEERWTVVDISSLPSIAESFTTSVRKVELNSSVSNVGERRLGGHRHQMGDFWNMSIFWNFCLVLYYVIFHVVLAYYCVDKLSFLLGIVWFTFDWSRISRCPPFDFEFTVIELQLIGSIYRPFRVSWKSLTYALDCFACWKTTQNELLSIFGVRFSHVFMDILPFF